VATSFSGDNRDVDRYQFDAKCRLQADIYDGDSRTRPRDRLTGSAMSAESSSDVKFEIGHVLFIDIVGYSKLMITEQSEQQRRWQKEAACDD